MSANPIPLPQNDQTAAATLQRLLTQQTPQAQGQASFGPAIPQPMLRPIQPIQPGGGVAQGNFQSKGQHQRASMQSLSTSVQNLAASVANAHAQKENKQLQTTFATFTNATKGMQAADEQIKNAQAVLQQDPQNQQAQQMLQQAQQQKQANATVLNQLVGDTPQGKKNAKLLSKGFGFDDKNADTPERAAAIAAMKQASQQSTTSQTPAMSLPNGQQLPAGQQTQVTNQGSGLNQGAASMLSRFPQTLQMSPQTQVNAEMVKAGVTPKAATGGQILQNENTAAKTVTQQQTAQDKLDYNYTRIGLDPSTGTPIPLDQLPEAQRAKVASERASDGLKAATAKYAQARTAALQDPNSPGNQLALMRAAAMQKFANASMLRAQVGLLNYRMNSTSTGEDGKPIPGATVIGGVPIGKAYAAQATKAIQTQAQFIDADGAIDNLTAATKALDAAGGKPNDPRLVRLMTDPHFTKSQNLDSFNNWIGGEVGSTLSPEQRDYLIYQKQARENIMAIRRVLGTGVSVKSMDAITNTLPGAQTPDFDYAMRQLQAVKGQLGRLQQGVPQLNLPQKPDASIPPPIGIKADPLGIF